MKVRILLVILAMALIGAGPAAAGKIGFVDAERAVAEVDEGKAKFKALEEWAEPYRQEIRELTDQYREMEQRVKKQVAVATPDAIAQMQEDEKVLRRKIEDRRRDFERQMEAKTDEFLKDVATKVGTVASDYARDNGYDAVFVLNAQPLIYISDGADLTDLVVRLYNERFPAN